MLVSIDPVLVQPVRGAAGSRETANRLSGLINLTIAGDIVVSYQRLWSIS